jgi:hypothetical protein
MTIGLQSIKYIQVCFVYYEHESSFLSERYYISILNGGANTCVLGKGWEVLSIHSSSRATVFGFDNKPAIKWNLSIVNAITALDLLNRQYILLRDSVHDTS